MDLREQVTLRLHRCRHVVQPRYQVAYGRDFGTAYVAYAQMLFGFRTFLLTQEVVHIIMNAVFPHMARHFSSISRSSFLAL